MVSGGLSPHADTDTSGSIGFRNFLIEMYERGAAQKADAIGIHPYPGVGPGEDYLADVRVYLGKVQNVMDRYGDGARPLWATEFGVSTAGDQAFDPAARAQAVSELLRDVPPHPRDRARDRPPLRRGPGARRPRGRLRGPQQEPEPEARLLRPRDPRRRAGVYRLLERLRALSRAASSAAPQRMSCSETSISVSPKARITCDQDHDPGDDRRRPALVQARDLRAARRAASTASSESIRWIDSSESR